MKADRTDVALSWWLKQALADAPSAQAELRGPTKADVCIVGGGYTGLWTALKLKERDPALDVVLLEARTCGSGASGRNGGMLLSWWAKLGTLVKLFGADEGTRLAVASAKAIDDIADFCVKNGIEAHLHKEGWLWTATNDAQRGAWSDAIEIADRRGYQPFRELAVDEVVSSAGSATHVGGVHEASGATVQPAMLARGLRRVALERGVRIHEHSPMVSWSVDGKAKVTTEQGAVTADRVVMATNAWMVRERQIARSLVVVTSDMVVTKPIPSLLAETGPRGGLGVSDSRMLVNYYRTTHDDRFAFGHGGGSFAFGRSPGRSASEACWRTDAVSQAMQQLYPRIGPDLVEMSWTGPIDRSISSVPFFGALEPTGTVLYGVGFSGNGVAPTYLGGMILSSLVLGVEDEWTTSRIAQGPVGTYPPEPLKFIGGVTLRSVLARKERTEDRNKKPGPVIQALSRLAPPGLVPVRKNTKPQESRNAND